MAHALVIRTAGTNCDAEMVRAFELCGARVTLLHLDRLIGEPGRLDEADLVGFPGGFSYGDDIASGRVWAMRLRERLYPALRAAAARGCPMIGVCNGFQALVQVGLLPGPADGAWPPDRPPPQELALAPNAGGLFIDRWVRVGVSPDSPCIWTRGLQRAGADSPDPDAVLRLPIAHGEGRLVAAAPQVIARLEANGQIPLRYLDNPNGSTADAAGVCDLSGRIFGLMPHPERYLHWVHHPFWTRLGAQVRRGDPPGLAMFRSAVEAASGARV
ncbi:MAG TPA: phosphoribosylformylglycinamidine synthase subunit PurQ [Phycisphaerales bacterium]|nr:phosphoribosylformylglycinamidine synthase subunit PurQ [Phycisphaerales bacterium]